MLNNVLPSLTDSPSLSDAMHGGVGLEWPYNLTVAFKVAESTWPLAAEY